MCGRGRSRRKGRRGRPRRWESAGLGCQRAKAGEDPQIRPTAQNAASHRSLARARTWVPALQRPSRRAAFSARRLVVVSSPGARGETHGHDKELTQGATSPRLASIVRDPSVRDRRILDDRRRAGVKAQSRSPRIVAGPGWDPVDPFRFPAGSTLARALQYSPANETPRHSKSGTLLNGPSLTTATSLPRLPRTKVVNRHPPPARRSLPF